MQTPETRREAKREANRRYYERHPEARREEVRRYEKRHPERVREKSRRCHLKRKYGLTPEQFDAMLAEQGGRCAACRGGGHNGLNWHVDHCHETGRVRGLLCVGCNTALGSLKEDPLRMLALADYITDA